MKKQELIALHRLLKMIADKADENSDIDVDEKFEMDEYRDLGVSAMGIHNKKDEQKEAVLMLSQKVSQGIEQYADEVDVIESNGESVSIDEMKETQRTVQEQVANRSDQFDSKDKSESETTESSESSDSQEDTSGPDWSSFS